MGGHDKYFWPFLHYQQQPILSTTLSAFFSMHNGKSLIMGFQGYNTDFLITSVFKIDSLNTIYSDTVSGCARWAWAHPEFRF
jgi:hypothetical protein